MASGGPPDISYSGQDQDNSGHELGPAYLLQNIPMSSQARMQMLVGEEFVCVCVCVFSFSFVLFFFSLMCVKERTRRNGSHLSEDNGPKAIDVMAPSSE